MNMRDYPLRHKCTGTACNKKDTSVNEHKRLYNTTLRHKIRK